ncbi:SDR family NAD(P)-dependent oxidoreductase [Thalassomonas sp. M1454]|uniref:SDR family NAD(P)-dependent oxidoreductase n=1 Tax=Thalassomonas sp. M1454 TaxID=2594477 RepID=UPI00117DB020|nr:SDR family NAD(P)-dependent oxidoreductase [Thalassomonas sp. M1454]TRX56514.1 SDR family NAD(P)-dependent oxidoreductase [Thalassomonas sp. M1454]
MFAQKFPLKRAFITGAASGLGLEIASQLASNNWNLAIADINEERLNSAKVELEKLGAKVITIVLNVTDAEAMFSAAERVEKELGGVDLVFNNAGVAGAGKITEISDDEWKRVVSIDLWSVIYGCRAFIPMMKKQGGGHIVNTASSAGTLSAAEMANYNVAKAGVVSLSETLKVELAPDNIGVTVLCPTVFKTNLGESVSGKTAFERNLQQQLAESKITSADIVAKAFNAVKTNKLYVMPQNDAKWGWRIKRLMPETYAKLMAYMYKNRIWIYKHLD